MATSRSSLARLLEPQSVAVIGASTDPMKVGGRAMRSIRTSEFSGDVWAVNPKAPEIMGYPCFPGMGALPGTPDLLVISVPIENIFAAIDKGRAMGAGGAIICASGFAELGDKGRELQAQLQAKAGPDFRLFGPNTQGYVNAAIGLSVNFSHRFVAYPPAPLTGQPAVAVLSQGGGGGSHLYEAASEAGLEISHYYPTGNEVDVDFVEIAEYLLNERGVKHILCMVEMVRRPEKLREVAALAASKDATLAIFLSAKNPAGLRAAASHTASLGTAPRAWKAFCQQAGIVTADSVSELVDVGLLQVKSRQPRGPKVGVLTNSGSAAVMIADACDEFGLQVPELSDAAQETATAIAGRSYIRIGNPMDVGVAANPMRLHPLLVEMIRKEGFDAFVFAVANQYVKAGADVAGIVEMIRSVAADSDIPVVPIWPSGDVLGLEGFRDAGLPVFRDVRPAVQALARLWDANRLRGAGDMAAVNGADLTAADFADEDTAKKTVARFGLDVPRAIVVRDAAEAKAAADTLGRGRVVLKGLRPGLLHKTERGLVRVGIRPEDIGPEFGEIRAAADRTAAAEPGGPFTFLVEEMLEGAAAELLLSVRREPSVGLTLTIGWGGSQVELLDDIACVSLPADRAAFAAALESLRCYPLLTGYRGKAGGSVPAVIDAMERAQALALSLGEGVGGIEINPLAVRANDAVVLDVIAEIAGAEHA